MQPRQRNDRNASVLVSFQSTCFHGGLVVLTSDGTNKVSSSYQIATYFKG